MILLALALAAAEAPPALPQAPKCRSPQVERAGRAPEARIEPLDRQPDAEQYLAVWRTVDGCPTPVKVREARR